MTKEEIIEEVSTAVPEASKATVKAVVNSTFVAISAALQNGEQVSIPKFGIFEVRESAPRTGRNPQTGEAVAIGAKKRVGFRASSHVKSLLA